MSDKNIEEPQHGGTFENGHWKGITEQKIDNIEKTVGRIETTVEGLIKEVAGFNRQQLVITNSLEDRTSSLEIWKSDCAAKSSGWGTALRQLVVQLFITVATVITSLLFLFWTHILKAGGK